MDAVEEFLEALPESVAVRARAIDAIIVEEAPGLERIVMGTTIGYGPYRYRYASGREGESARIVLGPRRGGITVHICEGLSGPVAGGNPGVGCIRIKALERLDVAALRREIARAATMTLSNEAPPDPR